MADRIRRVAFAAVALPLLFLAMSGLARAAGVVTNCTTFGPAAGTLEAALTGGGSVTFACSGTIVVPQIDISSGTTTVNAAGQNVTLSGNNTNTVFGVSPGATLNLENLTIANGSSPTFGGAISSSGTLTVTNCTLSNNSAALSGGGINNGGTLTVTNSTFSGNQATNDGGAILNFAILNFVVTATVTNSTFSDNRANSGFGGGIFNFDGSATLKGTILADESHGGNCGASGASFGDAGYNISDDGSCGFTIPPTGTSVNNSTTLNLDPAGLQNNGGPTQTIALEPNSQAVDFIPVADCTDQSSPTPLPLTTDQRGFPRPDPGNPDFCDAGAFELQTVPFVLVPNSERLQIARGTTPDSDEVNTAFTFIENGFPACDAGDDAFNGLTVVIEHGTCATLDNAAVVLDLNSWTVHTINHESYGTFFESSPPETISARMVALPTPAAPACGEWTINIEVTGVDTAGFGNGPFALILSNPDGDTGCFDITNAIVGNQIPVPVRKVRRGVRR